VAHHDAHDDAHLGAHGMRRPSRAA
jgi:hypothetical protein